MSTLVAHNILSKRIYMLYFNFPSWKSVIRNFEEFLDVNTGIST